MRHLKPVALAEYFLKLIASGIFGRQKSMGLKLIAGYGP
jgi:hypothetical protein